MTKPFKKNKVIVSDSMDATIAQDIYGLFKSLELEMDDISQVYTNKPSDKDYSMNQIKTVSKEMIRLNNEIDSKMSGSYLISSAEYDEEGVETSPAVYFEPTTKQALIDSLSSSLLDITIFANDKIVYDKGDYDADRTWEEFVAIY